MKKIGFTIVELLGVIIVLSLIALIIIPIVSGSIEKARRAAFEDSVYQTFKETERYLLKNGLSDIPEGGIPVTDMDFENNNFISGEIVIGSTGNLKVVSISDGTYCAIGEKDNLVIYDGDCDLHLPTCDLESDIPKGVLGWYASNPLIKMQTRPVKTGFLLYGIGLSENYDYRIEKVGKIGTATYQTQGDSPVKVYCYVKNYADVKGQNEMLVQIDKTAPTSASFNHTISDYNLTVVASGTDAESGIAMYQFSIDNGATWTPAQDSNTYIFKNLQAQIYSVKVRVYNGTYVSEKGTSNLHIDSEAKQISMAHLQTPTYTVSPDTWTKEDVSVTVNFQRDGAYLVKTDISVTSNIPAKSCSNVSNGAYTCEGGETTTLQAGTWYQVGSSPTLIFNQNGSIIAQVADGINYKSGSSLTIGHIDRVKPVSYVNLIGSIVGSNGWYQSVTMQVGKTSSGPSGISKIYYCNTSESTCNPTTVATDGQRISLPNQASVQRICSKAVSTTGVTGDITCSDAYKVDGAKPVSYVRASSSTTGENGWYRAVTLQVGATSVGTSGLSKVYYCGTSSTTCNPTAAANNGQTIALSNTSGHRVCSKVVSVSGMTSDTICSGLYKVDSAKPVSYVRASSSTAGENGWYKALTLQVGATSAGTSGLSKVYYCTTTSTSCNPTTVTNNGQTFAVGNTTAYRLCSKVVNTAGVSSDTVCSGLYKVDSAKPVSYAKVYSSTAGVNSGWYHAMKMQVGATSTGVSGVSKVYFCATSSSSCTPNIAVSNNYVVSAIESKTSRVCSKVVSASGVESAVTCTNAYQVDLNPPSITYTKSGTNVTITFRDNLALYRYTIVHIATDTTTTSTGWQTISGTSKTINYSMNKAGNYYIYLDDASGRELYEQIPVASATYPAVAVETVCHGQVYTEYGSHYVHGCRICKWTDSNSYLADEDAEPGEDCYSHYQGGHTTTTYTCPEGGTLSGTTCIR